MPKVFKSISFEERDHDEISKAAAEYGRKVGVKVSVAKYLLMLHRKYQQEQKDDA